MATLYVKRHDTWPPVKATLEQLNPSTGNKEPINLTGAAKVKFIMKGKTVVVEGPPNCTGPNGGALDNTGKVEYAWAAGDTTVADTYQVEFEIEWTVTPRKIQTVPNQDYDEIIIQQDLGGA